jgi:hypothetical protein
MWSGAVRALENQNGLARSGGNEVKELGLVPLAGFEVTTEGLGAYSYDGHILIRPEVCGNPIHRRLGYHWASCRLQG